MLVTWGAMIYSSSARFMRVTASALVLPWTMSLATLLS